MNVIKVVKFVTCAVVGTGTTTVTNGIIRNNVEPVGLIQNISVAVASLTIGSMAVEATRDHACNRIDQLAELWHSVNETQEEEPTTENV